MASVVQYLPLTRYLSVQLRPVNLIGNDHIVQNLLGVQQAGHSLGKGIQDSLIFRSASRFTASGSENFASFRRLPRISTL